jgi:hypothetical protein
MQCWSLQAYSLPRLVAIGCAVEALIARVALQLWSAARVYVIGLRPLAWAPCWSPASSSICSSRVEPVCFQWAATFGQWSVSDVLIRIALAVKRLRCHCRSRLRRLGVPGADPLDPMIAAGGRPSSDGPKVAGRDYNLRCNIYKYTRLPCIKLLELLLECLVMSRSAASPQSSY